MTIKESLYTIDHRFRKLSYNIIDNLRFSKMYERRKKLHENFLKYRETTSIEAINQSKEIINHIEELTPLVPWNPYDIKDVEDTGHKIDVYTKEIENEYNDLKKFQDLNWIPDGLTIKEKNSIQEKDIEVYINALNKYRDFAKSYGGYVPKGFLE